MAKQYFLTLKIPMVMGCFHFHHCVREHAKTIRWCHSKYMNNAFVALTHFQSSLAGKQLKKEYKLFQQIKFLLTT